MADTLTLRSCSVSRPVSYSFAFDGCGWAIFTVNEVTGELSISSDWGTYGHRWPVGHQGTRPDGSLVQLTEFLARCDGDYVVRKLQLDTQSKELVDIVDQGQTLKELLLHIKEQRRHRYIGADNAREYRELAKEWDRSGFELAACPDDLDEFLGEPWEWVRHTHSCRYVFLRDTLWPFFRSWLRENVFSVGVGLVVGGLAGGSR